MNDAGGVLMAIPIGVAAGCELPCRQVDPELFFAEAPADVEEAGDVFQREHHAGDGGFPQERHGHVGERAQGNEGDLAGMRVDRVDDRFLDCAFRREIATGEHSQIVAMTIPAGGEIGEEVHEENDQLLVFVDGEGDAVLDVGRSVRDPGVSVVDVAPVGGDLAALGAAGLVAGEDQAALPRGVEAFRAAVVQRLGVPAQHTGTIPASHAASSPCE